MNSPGAASRERRAAVRRWTPVLSLPLILLVGATAPSVTLIEIVPSSVFVQNDRPKTSFTLEARLWTGDPADRRSIIESDGVPVTWSPSTGLTKKSQQGFRAVFEVDGTFQGTATVTAQAGGRTSTATVKVANAAGPGEDFLTATYTPDQIPDVVLASGIRNAATGPCGVTFAAFVAGVGLGNVMNPCTGAGGAWEAAVLSVSHNSVVATGQWTGQQNTVDAGALQGARRVLPVALRVMLGDNALSDQQLADLREATMLMALAEIQSANGVLASTRTGLELAKPDTATVENLTPAEVDGYGRVAVAGCADGDDRTSSHDVDGKLNVYYVSWLYNARGRACPPHSGRKYPVIYVEVHQVLQTSFVHEVGHALALTLPQDGHTDVIGGLDVSNVMTSAYHDWDRGGRRRLTVGQVFRMNTDSASWLSWAQDANGALVRESAQPRLACQCGGHDPAGNCPRVADDVSQPSAVGDDTADRDCWDKLFLKNAPPTERPVAIIAGRRWRAPPGFCDPFLQGWNASRPNEVWVGLDNVTRHGNCASRAVLFYRHFGVQVVNLSEPTVGLAQVSDEPVVLGSPLKPFVVRVRLYNPGGVISPAIVTQDVDIAKAVFGSLNRSGIALVFTILTNSCPQGGPGAGEILACYAPGMQLEGRYIEPRTIRLGKARRNTLAHLIGRALGLSTQGDLPFNIMHPTPAERGKRLTVGQVFRINAALGVLSSCEDTACPPPELDMGP